MSALQVSSYSNHISQKPEFFVKPFLDVLLGEEKLSFDDLKKRVDILYHNRKEGNQTWINILQTPEGYEKHLTNLFNEYQKLERVTDLIKRAEMLNTIFMKTLCENLSTTLTEEEKYIITRILLPQSLVTYKAGYLLGIIPYKDWLEKYSLACTTSKTPDPIATSSTENNLSLHMS